MGSAGLWPGSRPLPDDLLSPQQLLHLVASSASSGQDSGQLIIDLRSRSRYHQRHIPGSHSIPSGRLISGEPPDGDLILVGETTLHSAATLEQLHAQGYARRIRHLAGGFEAWRQLELPVASQRKRSAPFRHGERFRTAVSGLLFGPWGRSRSRAGA
jgi:rhodanese-related sulfurtransferase